MSYAKINNKRFLNSFLLSFILLITTTANAQWSLSKFYPKPRVMTIVAKERTLAKNYLGGKPECVSGNCNNGEGTLVEASGYLDLASRSSYVIITYKIHKGSFSDKGKSFNGTVYTRQIFYNVIEEGNSSLTLKPDVEWNIKDESSWGPYESGMGSMKVRVGDDYNYIWTDKMTMTGEAVNKPKGVLKYDAWFGENGGHMKFVNIEYLPGKLFKKILGPVLESGELLGGRLEFTEGGMYEGYLCNGKFFGPGRYTGKDGVKEEGIWMMDSLISPMSVSLPPILFDPSAVNNVTKQLHYRGNDKPFFDAGGGWYYTEDGLICINTTKSDVTGSGIQITLEEPNRDSKYITHLYFTGNFSSGYLQNGTRVSNRFRVAYDPTLINNFYKYTSEGSSSVSGKFYNGALDEPCGKKYYYDNKGNLEGILEGHFFASYSGESPDGWHYVNDFSGSKDAATFVIIITVRILQSQTVRRISRKGLRQLVKTSNFVFRECRKMQKYFYPPSKQELTQFNAFRIT